MKSIKKGPKTAKPLSPELRERLLTQIKQAEARRLQAQVARLRFLRKLSF